MTGTKERSLEFYRILLENSFEGIAIVDADGVITFQNRAAAETLGSEVGELVGRNALDLIHPDDLEEAMTTLSKITDRSGVVRPNETRMRRQDTGEYVDLEVRAVLVDAPEIGGIVVNFRDVSAHRKAMKELALSEERLEIALEGAGLGLWDWNVKDDTLAFDDRLPVLLGVGPSELEKTGRAFFERIHPDERSSVDQELQAHFQGQSVFFEHEHRMAGVAGVYRWVVVRGRIVKRDEQGQPTRMAGTILDIDDRKRERDRNRQLEEQLQAAQRMESIGQLAGGIAHDFNNILQIILANAKFAETELEDPVALQESLREIDTAGQRAAELTQRLLAFGRRQSIQPVPCDINKQLEHSLRMLRRVLPESIDIDLIPGHRLATAYVDPGQFEQVITNLCVNARDAMPDGGRLTIETENVVINGEYRKKHLWAAPGRYVLVTVSDTGHGMKAETRLRVFEPFFTTKEEGVGTGLGLAMVHGIVRQHDGLIHVYSEPGVGTSFKLYWPSIERDATAVESQPEGAVPRGDETILVVEDEPAVLRLVIKVLETAGYHVLGAGDGEAALDVFARHREQIGLVLLDAVMPKKAGRDVYEAIREQAPTPVVFTSGYSAAALPMDFLTRNQLQVLPKPYSPDLLLRKVREVLDREASKRGPAAGS